YCIPAIQSDFSILFYSSLTSFKRSPHFSPPDKSSILGEVH
ncbi:unnamed protein product, partial [Onchocerca flexuosa]|uniref:Ovule protein n=1 Tax=Onchocerca flexuosa TaxID=387005 RepID=A0A183I5P9_9BILA